MQPIPAMSESDTCNTAYTDGGAGPDKRAEIDEGDSRRQIKTGVLLSNDWVVLDLLVLLFRSYLFLFASMKRSSPTQINNKLIGNASHFPRGNDVAMSLYFLTIIQNLSNHF